MALTAVEEAQLRDLIAQQSALLSLAGVEATILSKLGATKVTLSDLVAASSVADTDLLLTRQGTTDKSLTAAILAAYVLADVDLSPYALLNSPTFTGNPAAPTPNQFDNDTSLATTAFVQRALGNRSSNIELTAATTLTAANAGNLINLSTSAFTVTLPLLSTCPPGTEFVFHNDNTASSCTISIQGADSIAVAGAPTSSITIKSGEFLVINAQTTSWRAYGSAILKNEAQFLASLSASGYQKLPSGLIIQWGSVGAISSTTATSSASALPISFPTAGLQVTAVIASDISNSATPFTVYAANVSQTQVSIVHARSSASISNSWRYIAIGY